MPQRRRNPALLFLLVPLIVICSCGGCCAWAFGSPIVPLVMGQSALIFFGQQTEGTIDALEPCQSGVTFGSTPNGFDLRIGDSTAKTFTVRVRYDDVSGAQVGQTIACTEFTYPAAVGDRVAVRFRPDAPGDILLEKDRSLYQTFAMTAWGSIVLLVALVALLAAPIRRRAAQQSVAPTPAIQALPAVQAPSPSMSGAQQTYVRLHQAAVGSSNYATSEIRLKEALMLLHLRQTSDGPTDEKPSRDRTVPLKDHLVLAAMLMDLILHGRLAMRREGLFGASTRLEVLGQAPLGDPDTDMLLSTLATWGQLQGTHLRSFFIHYARTHHLAARLIDQLRQGGYVRLHQPTAGRYADENRQSASILGQMMSQVFQLFWPMAFNHGTLVATDDFSRALPWQFLYTTRTQDEERVYGRVQDAIAARWSSDEFIHALLVLVAAQYMPTSILWRRSARKSIYRFYSPAQQREIVNFLRTMADQAPESEYALYHFVRSVDELIENPPAAG